MLQYITIDKYRHLKNLINLWNGDFRGSYPIKKTLYRDLILDDPNLNKDASFVALYDNEPVGFIFIKTWLNDTGLADESSTAHISLIFVKKEMRNMGIGSDMLQLSLAEIKKHKNITSLVVGNEINMLFPGVPSDLNEAPIFFMNKDFVQRETAVDMIRVVRNDKVEEINKDLEISIATEDEKNELIRLCVDNGWHREAYKVNQYYEKGGSGRRIATAAIDGKIIAFARFNDTNKIISRTSPFIKDKYLGSILYVKVAKEYENTDYLEMMNKVAKNYLIKRGLKKIVVLDTKDIRFYKKLGFSAYKYYLQFELSI